jgi:hypothetical protein
MNKHHADLLGTAGWAAFLHEEILPVVTHGVDLGDDLLEIGPGPGAATDWLRHRVRRLVAVELDPQAAAALGERFEGTNVEAIAGARGLSHPAADDRLQRGHDHRRRPPAVSRPEGAGDVTSPLTVSAVAHGS